MNNNEETASGNWRLSENSIRRDEFSKTNFSTIQAFCKYPPWFIHISSQILCNLHGEFADNFLAYKACL